MRTLRALLPLVAMVTVAGCAHAPLEWRDFDALRDPAPRPRRTLGGHVVSAEDYLRFRKLGELWFRGETFGNERTISDVTGFLGASVEVPCAGEPPGSCVRRVPALSYFAEAIDALDGVPLNLFQGNGGAYTSDLVITFPRGASVHGVPLPERVHTGLDVEAGSPWPIGIVPVAASASDAALPHLIDPAELGRGPAKSEKLRLGLSCATCHYSLDIDWDGRADLASAFSDRPTAGSPYRPEHAWAVGNQDIALGYLLALSSNPLSVFSVFSGVIGGRSNAHARAWGAWIKQNYRRVPDGVVREVVTGMTMQPRGFADDTPDGLFNAIQIPSLYTRYNWPYNYDGNFASAEDRNNGVWSTALDITALVGLANDRGGRLANFTPGAKTIYNEFSARELAELFVYAAPAARNDPARRDALAADVLGTADGVPGLLDPHAVVLVPGLPHSIPDAIREHADNVRLGRNREPESFGGDAGLRRSVLGYTGVRVITPKDVRQALDVAELSRRYGFNADEFFSQAVSLMLDSLDPPPNLSPLLRGQSALVERGYRVFERHGCARCHRGPFFTDNLVHSLSELGTEPGRAEFGRSLQLFLTPTYDPQSGKALSDFPIDLPGRRVVGYKTVTLRYLFGSAPYLHDGGVAVGLRPDAAPEGDDLRALLARPGEDKLYGTAPILAYRDAHPESRYRANAALSLQALLLESERRHVVDANRRAVLPLTLSSRRLRGVDFGIHGVGHEFFVADGPGGDEITALVAFLLALDDAPSALPP